MTRQKSILSVQRKCLINTHAINASKDLNDTADNGQQTRKALPVEAAQRDAIAKLQFLRLRIWAADKHSAILFRFSVGSHVNAAWSVCDRPGTEQRTEVPGWVKNSGPILSRLWTKVHEILTGCRRPLVASNALARADCAYRVSFRRHNNLSLNCC